MKLYFEDSEIINKVFNEEAQQIFKAYFQDTNGNEYKLSSKGLLLSKHTKIPHNLSRIGYMVSQGKVKEEEGNTGTKHYVSFIKKRIAQAAKEANDDKSFASKLNIIFNRKDFHGSPFSHWGK